MKTWWLVLGVLGACGDNSPVDIDDLDNGIDPGQQRGDIAQCAVEGPDGDPTGDCMLSSGGSFRADLNGDGESDLVIGSPFTDVDGVVDAGVVLIFWNANTTRTPQVLTQNMPGTGDLAEPGDRFGWSVSPFDATGHGISDLVVGVPYEDVGTLVDAGCIHVFVGVNGGGGTAPQITPVVSPTLPPMITQDTGEVDDVAEAGDLFGFSLAWGQLRTNSTNVFDLAVGVPGEDIDGAVDAGAVNILFESNNSGIKPKGKLLHQGLPGMKETPEAGDNFGYAIAVSQQRIDFADIGHPTYIAIGVPGEDVGTIADAGVVHVVPPSDTGPDPLGSQLWSQDSPNVPGACEPGDRFGEVLATRAFGGRSATPDLLVGVPHEDLVTATGANAADAGMVHVFFTAGFGLTAKYTRVFTQADNPTELIEPGDLFGAAISGGPVRGDAVLETTPNDLVIAAPFEDLEGAPNAGVIHYIRQTSPAVFDAGTVIGIQSTTGYQAAAGDMFGYSMTSWQFGFSLGVQLVVGIPGRNVLANGTTFTSAGTAFVLKGDANGLVGAAHKIFTMSNTGRTPVSKEFFARVMY